MLGDRRLIVARLMIAPPLVGAHDGIEPHGVEVEHAHVVALSVEAADGGVPHRGREALRNRMAIDDEHPHGPPLPRRDKGW